MVIRKSYRYKQRPMEHGYVWLLGSPIGTSSALQNMDVQTVQTLYGMDMLFCYVAVSLVKTVVCRAQTYSIEIQVSHLYKQHSVQLGRAVLLYGSPAGTSSGLWSLNMLFWYIEVSLVQAAVYRAQACCFEILVSRRYKQRSIELERFIWINER